MLRILSFHRVRAAVPDKQTVTVVHSMSESNNAKAISRIIAESLVSEASNPTKQVSKLRVIDEARMLLLTHELGTIRECEGFLDYCSFVH